MSDEIDRLLARLLELTEAGRVVWTRGSGGGSESAQVVRVDTPGGSVTLFPRDWDDSPPFILEIRDRDGNLLEQRETSRAVNPETGDEEWPDWVLDTLVLYRKAKDSAVASVVNDILSSLEEPEPF